MNLLLDTHVLLWAQSEPAKLSDDIRDVISDGRNLVYVSAATAWEITIKKALGKLRAPDNYFEALEHSRFTPLSIDSKHALEVGNLPMHHADPFDRMLIAQAREENLTLVTHDRRFKEYDVSLLFNRG